MSPCYQRNTEKTTGKPHYQILANSFLIISVRTDSYTTRISIIYYVLSHTIVEYIRCYSSLDILYFFSTMYYFHKQAKWLVTSIYQIDNKTTNISNQILFLNHKIHFPSMYRMIASPEKSNFPMYQLLFYH